MSDFILFTDSACDLSEQMAKEMDVNVIGIAWNNNGKEYIENFGNNVSHKDFYDGLRNGDMPATAQINTYRFNEIFEPFIKEGKSILYICFSSKLSGTYESSVRSAKELSETYPDADITIIDSKSASLGLGLLVKYASDMKKNGASKDEVAAWLEENKYKMNHIFTVDDLNFLKRGGRVSATAAVLGTMLSIKPVLYMPDDGSLQPYAKVKGRAKAIDKLYKQFADNVVEPENQVIYISHGDCLQDAKKLADKIRQNFNVRDIVINYIGAVIGSHSGVGTLALFFLGNNRSVSK